MLANQYRVIFGTFLIIGREPDGDTLRFRPNKQFLLQFKDRGNALDPQDDAITIRLEGMDAPETHFRGNANQGLFAITARDKLLTEMGFDPVTYDQTNTNPPRPTFEVATANPNPVTGAVLCRGADANSRAVVYILKKTSAQLAALGLNDGDEIEVGEPLLKQTINYQLISLGMGYPLPFDTTPEAHRLLFAAAASQASQANPPLGVWATDATHSFTSGQVLASAGANARTILPGLFRRWIDYQRAVADDPALANKRLGQWIADSENEILPSLKRDVTLRYPNGFVTKLSALIQHTLTTGSIAVSRPVAANGAAVYDAVVVTNPAERTLLADKEVWSTLAKGEEPWMYAGGQYHAGSTIHGLLKRMAGCRASTCPVPKRHPFYRNEAPPVLPAPDGSQDLTQLDRASNPSCMPVVPVRTAVGRIMFWGSFPTAKFTTRIREPAKSNQFFVPVCDIAAPLEGVPYFDGYKGRDVLTAELFQREYIQGVDLDTATDVWLTNLIKCFLFKETHVKAYESLGWTKANPGAGINLPVDVQETAYELLPETAAVCTQRFLVEEVNLCKPKLIVTVGAWSYMYMRNILKPAVAPATVKQESIGHIVGVPLRAGSDAGDSKDKRTATWKALNVMHLYHPEAVMRARDDGNNDLIARHKASLEKLKDFIAELKETEGLVLG